MAGLVPGAVCLLLTPALMYVLYPPEVKDTPDAPAKVGFFLRDQSATTRDREQFIVQIGRSSAPPVRMHGWRHAYALPFGSLLSRHARWPRRRARSWPSWAP